MAEATAGSEELNTNHVWRDLQLVDDLDHHHHSRWIDRLIYKLPRKLATRTFRKMAAKHHLKHMAPRVLKNHNPLHHHKHEKNAQVEGEGASESSASSSNGGDDDGAGEEEELDSEVVVLPIPEDVSMSHHVKSPPDPMTRYAQRPRHDKSDEVPATSSGAAATTTSSANSWTSMMTSALPGAITSRLPSALQNVPNPEANLGPFQNPWPSWQNFSLSDAYRAYQKGATLGKPPPDESDTMKIERKAQQDQDTSETTHEVRKLERKDGEKHGRYVRVKRPRWKRSAKEQICWLGHAGVLVRLPYPGRHEEATTATEENEDEEEDDDTGMVGILFDPIFSKRCSPAQFVGPSRYLDAPCYVADLPPVHICCISHDHYDHLDYQTIMDLYHSQGRRVQFFVPLGVRKWFLECGIPGRQVHELDWHQEAIVTIPRSASDAEHNASAMGQEHGGGNNGSLTLKVICTPAQHRSGRSLASQMSTLWASWIVGVIGERTRSDGLRKAAECAIDPLVISKSRASYEFPAPGMESEEAEREEGFAFGESDGFRIYHAGDTGFRYAGAPEEKKEEAMCPAFKDIGRRYGPVDLALLPISTGSSLSFLRSMMGVSLNQYDMTSSQHSNAWDAMQIAKIVGSKSAVAIHHSTFSPEDEARGTTHEFDVTRDAENIPRNWGERGCFVVCDVGEVLDMGAFDEQGKTQQQH